jgi:hypothetical protein
MSRSLQGRPLQWAGRSYGKEMWSWEMTGDVCTVGMFAAVDTWISSWKQGCRGVGPVGDCGGNNPAGVWKGGL